MQHLAIAAAATAIAIGAGSGVLTGGTRAPKPPVEMSNPMIAGTAMSPSASILQNAANSPEHRTFVSQIRAAGLSPVLGSGGSYTVFAPTDAAYAALRKTGPGGVSQNAQKDARYLIVKGRYDSTRLLQLIEEQGGQAKLRTLEGGTIVASLNGPTNILLMDENGTMADIAIYDIHQKNGVMQVIDRVLEPARNSRKLAAR